MIPSANDKPLFTPGPLTTSRTVKQAMLRDLGSRDDEFIQTVARIREKLLGLAGVSKAAGYEAILMQGSGTFGIESVISSAIPADGKFLVIINGAYGQRIRRIAEVHKIDCVTIECIENQAPTPEEVNNTLSADPAITHVAIVHCETTSGIINPIEAIGAVVRKHGKVYIVDSMSAFGAVPFDMQASELDYLISSSNKCIEGVPGFSFIICRREALATIEGQARSLSLDLFHQWQGLEANGQFRFTPPTHSILAFEQALDELDGEGGIEGRARRYQQNYHCLRDGMREMGFEEYVPEDLQGYIITSFLFPQHPNFNFDAFYQKLNEKGFVIYPGKVADAECFRIGNIGRLFTSDVGNLLRAIRLILVEMNISMPAESTSL